MHTYSSMSIELSKFWSTAYARDENRNRMAMAVSMHLTWFGAIDAVDDEFQQKVTENFIPELKQINKCARLEKVALTCDQVIARIVNILTLVEKWSETTSEYTDLGVRGKNLVCLLGRLIPLFHYCYNCSHNLLLI